MTLTGGSAATGSAIRIGDANDTQLSDVVITGNAGGSAVILLDVGSRLTATNSSFTNNDAGGNAGGAINANAAGVAHTTDVVVLTNCTLSGNTNASNGGAVYITFDGQLTVTGSTFSANTANTGGAIFLGNGKGVITNSTLANNVTTSATNGGGAIRLFGTGAEVVVNNSTISGNVSSAPGGGIAKTSATAGSVTLTSTIVAGNTSAGGGIDLFSSAADTFTINNSLIGVADDGNFAITGASNKTGTTATPLDAKLGALANNGGPTQTMALLDGSPALNNGSNLLSLSFDQRGLTRTAGAGTDMGAFERQAPTISSITFGDGTAQRSMVKQFVVTFSEAVNFSGAVANAFTLFRNGTNSSQPGGSGNVTLTASPASGPASSVTITFSGGFTTNGSLNDGFYDLTIDASQVSGTGGALDGENNPGFPSGDGTAGGNYVLTGTTANKFFRLFGDGNGDGITNLTDFAAFRAVFNLGANAAFDYDNSGNVDLGDFAQFRARFNLTP